MFYINPGELRAKIRAQKPVKTGAGSFASVSWLDISSVTNSDAPRYIPAKWEALKGAEKWAAESVQADIILPNFDMFLQKAAAAGNSIDDLCLKAVNEALPIVEASMKDGAARHRKGAGKYGTDAVYDAIESTPAKKQGNLVYGSVGIDVNKHPEAKHAVFQEYGDGHSPEFPDPFVRPAIDDNRKKVAAVMRDVLKKGGVPIE